ncbi:complement C1q domain-containing protein [Planctomycetota bacterium]|nr:complement C1q domain-containing protein [Planctomycetota bacterium]
MGYIGNSTSASYTSLDKQTITGNGGASYTLTHAVANEQEIEVFVNNVRQEPGVAYTVSGTALTMTGNVTSTDDFYIVYQGKALQSVVPPDNSITNAKLASGAAAANLGSSINLSTIKDSSGTNTAISINSDGVVYNPQKPFVSVQMDGSLGYLAHAAGDVVKFSAVYSGDASLYNTTTYKFTCPVDGIYLATYQVIIASATDYAISLYKNNTRINIGFESGRGNGNTDVVSCSAGDELYWVSYSALAYYQGTGDSRYSWGSYALIG